MCYNTRYHRQETVLTEIGGYILRYCENEVKIKNGHKCDLGPFLQTRTHIARTPDSGVK